MKLNHSETSYLPIAEALTEGGFAFVQRDIEAQKKGGLAPDGCICTLVPAWLLPAFAQRRRPVLWVTLPDHYKSAMPKLIEHEVDVALSNDLLQPSPVVSFSDGTLQLTLNAYWTMDAAGREHDFVLLVTCADGVWVRRQVPSDWTKFMEEVETMVEESRRRHQEASFLSDSTLRRLDLLEASARASRSTWSLEPEHLHLSDFRETRCLTVKEAAAQERRFEAIHLQLKAAQGKEGPTAVTYTLVHEPLPSLAALPVVWIYLPPELHPAAVEFVNGFTSLGCVSDDSLGVYLRGAGCSASFWSWHSDRDYNCCLVVTCGDSVWIRHCIEPDPEGHEEWVLATRSMWHYRFCDPLWLLEEADEKEAIREEPGVLTTVLVSLEAQP
ncbi:hypothetical protein [Variovorax sp. YR216]|uniref:hypothetical protein n=1 Tax=Variovorax sp. YR216 TaxID=1882828 RepID=UPI000898173E|nr:hypothetical protein [Variovorax sp. YR216]SEA98423.1 hypothetical protein SAMN05444680_10516 [Variovorax sp. YR216]